MERSYKNVGSRGGRSYHTLRRKKISASSIKKSTGLVFSNTAQSIVEPFQQISESSICTSQQNFQSGDTTEEVVEDEESSTFIFSDDDGENNSDNDLPQVENDLKNGRFDSKAVETFKNLCNRHPSLSHSFIKDMLKSLIEIGVNVPQDPRTLLQSNAMPVVTEVVSPGIYWHFGIPALIERILSRGIKLPEMINLKVNVDGMPLANSSKATFWPIQMTISELGSTKPFLIGCYFHESQKPENVDAYLRAFVDDLVKMRTIGQCGVKVGKVIYPLDAPALSFVKRTQGHTGKHSCGKCSIVGVYLNKRICFPSLTNADREDALFKNHLTYGDHHKGTIPGPLEHTELNTDMITDFPAEPLHTIQLGVVKRILLCWTGTHKFGASCSAFQVQLRISDNNVKRVDNHMKTIQKYCPSEYNRPPRKISDVKYWKGGEFGCFLDHTALVALKNVLPKQVYDNFLLLHVAISICESNRHRSLLRIAKDIFKDFLGGFKLIYGDYAVSYNLHNLLHIPDDVTRFGPLDSYSTTAFEARLNTMKSLIRSGNRRLPQLANRWHETIDFYIDSIKKDIETVYPVKHSADSIEISRNCILKINNKDQWFMSKNKDIFRYEGYVIDSDGVTLKGRRVQAKECFYHIPIQSSMLDEYHSDGVLELKEVFIKLDNFLVKLFKIPNENELQFLFSPIRHTYNI